jgi:DNA polymerase lambda
LYFQEAYSIPFVGKRVADKIYEIVSSGHLRRLDHIDKDKQIVIDLFKGVHGIGQVLAEQYYAQVTLLIHFNVLELSRVIGLYKN